jgi:hypothetical protein
LDLSSQPFTIGHNSLKDSTTHDLPHRGFCAHSKNARTSLSARLPLPRIPREKKSLRRTSSLDQGAANVVDTVRRAVRRYDVPADDRIDVDYVLEGFPDDQAWVFFITLNWTLTRDYSDRKPHRSRQQTQNQLTHVLLFHLDNGPQTSAGSPLSLVITVCLGT